MKVKIEIKVIERLGDGSTSRSIDKKTWLEHRTARP